MADFTPIPVEEEFVPVPIEAEFTPIPIEESPSIARTGAGLVADVAIGEGSKAAATAAGAAAGTAILPGVGTAVGAGLGYVGGGIAGGVTGSIARQKIMRPDEDVRVGELVSDTLINLLPAGKAVKGASVGTRLAKGALKRGVAGGAIGAGSEVVEKAVEGERAETEDVVARAKMGALLGVGLGAAGSLVAPLVSKLSRKSPKEIADGIKAGKQEETIAYNALRELDPENVSQKLSPRGTLQQIVSRAKSSIAPSTRVGKEVTQFAREAKWEAEAGKAQGRFYGNKIEDTISGSANPKATSDSIDAFIMGQKVELTPEAKKIEDVLEAARSEIRTYQDKLLENHYNGTRVLSDDLKAKIEASQNSGDYLTREYRWHLDKSYKPSLKSRERLIKRLKRDGRSQKEVDRIFAGLEAARKDGADATYSFLKSSPNGVLKKQKDLPKEMREFLGEITSPGERIAGTMSKLAKLVAYDTSDHRIREKLLDLGMASKGGSAANEGLVALKLRRDPTNKVEDVFVHKDVQRAVNSLYGSGVVDNAENWAVKTLKDVFGSGIGATKAVKVIGNPPSYAVQFYGNVSSLIGMGMNPLKAVGHGAKLATMPIGKRAQNSSISSIKEFKRAQELGMVNPGVVYDDLRSGFDAGKVGETVSGVIEPLGKIYSVPDVTFRIVAWKNYQQLLAKAYPDASDKRLEEVAAELTNSTYQNYDFVNSGLKTLSRYGVLGQFATFTMELIRNQANQVALINRLRQGKVSGEDLGAGFERVNKGVLQKEAAIRAAALASVYGASSFGVAALNRENGIDEDTEKMLRESVLPDWDSNKELVLDMEGEKVYSKNVSYVIPHAQIAGVVTEALRADDPKEALQRGLGSLWEDMGGEGSFFGNALVNAIQNYDPSTGKEISAKADGLGSAMERAGWILSSEFTPGVARELDKYLRGQDIDQTVKRQFGWRVNDTTIEEGVGFKVRDARDKMKLARSQYNSDAYKYEGDSLQQSYADANNSYKQNMQELIKHADNLRGLGKSEDDVVRILKDNRIGGKEILNILNGKVTDMPVAKRETPSSKYEEFSHLPYAQRNKAIARVEDRELRKSLRRKSQRENAMERRGATAKDRVVMSLGVSDGTRAEAILSEMAASDNPEGVLNGYRRKGAVSDRVMKQIRERQ